MKKRAQITPSDTIGSRIRMIRGQKIILDAGLAAIYGVATSALNRAVKRNADRFPADFIFQLTNKEAETLRCQIGISHRGRGGRRFLPYAFTDNGAVITANVLNSSKAVRMGVFVVRAFVEMRELPSHSKELSLELKKLETKLTDRLDDHESAIIDVLRRLMELLDPPPTAPIEEKSMGFHTSLKFPTDLRTSVKSRNKRAT